MEEGGSSGGEKSSASPMKKKVIIPKDPHAPKKPLTAYNLFAADERAKMKKRNPDRSFGDMNREIGTLWSTLPVERKQPHTDRAEEDRQRYIREVEEYQKTDKYKNYLKTIAALQQRQQERKEEKEKSKQEKTKKMVSPSKAVKEKSPSPSRDTTNPLPPPSRPPPLSLKQSFVSGTDIPIFANQFLQHNRQLEVQVRKLRQTTMDMEEENALLSRHVDNMTAQVGRYEAEIQNQTFKNDSLKQHLILLQDMLTYAFSELDIPGIDSVPSVDTIESYLKELEVLVAGQPAGSGKYSDVVAKVKRVSEEVAERMKERDVETAMSDTEN